MKKGHQLIELCVSLSIYIHICVYIYMFIISIQVDLMCIFISIYFIYIHMINVPNVLLDLNIHTAGFSIYIYTSR